MAAIRRWVREATYQLSDGRSVWYDNGDALQDAADLYAVLSELHSTGSPNLENQQAQHILERLQAGAGLAEFHVGTLLKLLGKHADAIADYRQRREEMGQDPMDLANAGPEARIMNPTERSAV